MGADKVVSVLVFLLQPFLNSLNLCAVCYLARRILSHQLSGCVPLWGYDSTTELYRHFESGKTQDAQKAVDIISKNFGIVPPTLHYDWSGELDHNLNIKGQMSKGQLTISLTFTLSKFALAATVAHELMHYILVYRKNITLPDNTRE